MLQNLDNAMSNLFELLSQMETTKIEPEYRLYYDLESGEPLYYSMEDLPGDYITVDKKIYEEGRYDVKIVDGKLLRLSVKKSQKLIPSDSGTPTAKDNVLIVDPNSDFKWKLKIYYAD